MPHFRIGLMATAALTCGLLTSACATSGVNVTPSTGASAPSTGSAPQTGASGSRSPDFPSTSPAGLDTTTFDMSAALLVAGDLTGFTKTATDHSGSPLPCTPHEPALSDTYPAEQHGQAAFTSSSGEARFSEAVNVYSDDTDAQKFVAAGKRGFGCKLGQIGKNLVKIVPVASTTTTDFDVLERWDFKVIDGTLGTAILARKGPIIVGLTFQASKTGASEINPVTTLDKALAKVDAAD